VSFDLGRLLTDRRLWKGPAPWVLLTFVVANFWVGAHAELFQNLRTHNLLAIDPTAPADLSKSQYDISCGEGIGRFWQYIPDARSNRLIVISGMSQMHTINDRKPGDKLICQWMDDTLRPQGIRVWGEAGPNLCNEEALMQMIAFCNEPRTTPAVFIYALCFDKFRNLDLRPGYQDFLRARPDILAAYQQAADHYASQYPLASTKMKSSLADLKSEATEEDNSFETRVRAGVAKFVPLVAQRQDVNALLTIQIGMLRNAVLRITPTSKRPIIQSRYDMNREFLQMMADVALEHHVQFIVYVIPLNAQAENPYVTSEYEQFKIWAKKFADDRGLPFANFENLIPRDEWGFFMGGPDFKHFRGEGHRRTAEAIMQTFHPWLVGDPHAPKAVTQP